MPAAIAGMIRKPRNLTPRPAFAKLSLAANLVYARCNARAEVAELADAHGSGPCTRKGVEVQVLSSAPDSATSAPVPRGFVASGPVCADERRERAAVSGG